MLFRSAISFAGASEASNSSPVVSSFSDGVTPAGTSPSLTSHLEAASLSLIAFWQSWRSSTIDFVGAGVLLPPVASPALEAVAGVELRVPIATGGLARGKVWLKDIYFRVALDSEKSP